MKTTIMTAEYKEAISIARELRNQINKDSLEAANKDKLDMAKELFIEASNITKTIAGIVLRKIITSEDRSYIRSTAKYCYKLAAGANL